VAIISSDFDSQDLLQLPKNKVSATIWYWVCFELIDYVITILMGLALVGIYCISFTLSMWREPKIHTL
jgi:hypothetical protein